MSNRNALLGGVDPRLEGQITARRSLPSDYLRRGAANALMALGINPYTARGTAGRVTNALLNLTPLAVADDATAYAQQFGRQAQGGQVPAMPSIGAAVNAAELPAMFLGVKAAGAPLNALMQARKMQRARAPREDIWRETGWFKGADGKWRFEVDDSEAKFPKKYDELALKKGLPASEVVKHPALYNASPSMGDVNVKGGYGMGSMDGYYNPTEDALTLEVSRMNAAPASANSTILHELQHAAQKREGFARGGTPDRELLQMPEWRDIIRRRDQINESEAVKWFNDYQNGPNGYKANKTHKEIREDALKLRPELSEAFDVWDEVSRLRYEEAYERYRRLAGETEARNVQSRMNMSAAERRANAPWTTQDVPDELQIVRRR